MEVLKTQKGRPMLSIDGFTFIKYRQNDLKIYWKCSDKSVADQDIICMYVCNLLTVKHFLNCTIFGIISPIINMEYQTNCSDGISLLMNLSKTQYTINEKVTVQLFEFG